MVGGVREVLRPSIPGQLRPQDWITIDAVVALAYFGLLAGLSLPHVFHDHLNHRAGSLSLPGWLDWAAAVLVTAPVAIRRRWPRVVLGLVLLGTILGAAGGLHEAPFPALAYVLYSVAVACSRRDATAALVLTVGGVAVAYLASSGLSTLSPAASAQALPSLLFTSLTQIAVWLIGRTVRQQRAYSRGLAEQAARRAQAEIDAARAAVTEQRLRIARELHDIVGHSVSLMTVQAGAARMLAEARPDETRRMLRSIETTGRDCLRETRRVLGVLREEGEEGEERESADAAPGSPQLGEPAGLSPAPGLSDLPRLVVQNAEAGVTVAVRTAGQPRALPAAVDLAAYRIVQEALTNVVKHSTADRCQVALTYGSQELSIYVTNPAAGPRARLIPSAAGGHGLIGMRERARLYAGQFAAGPLPGGGFSVIIRIPLPDVTP